jgi:hypothetical protein
MTIMGGLHGVGIVFGHISGSPGTPNVQALTEAAVALGAAILSPYEALGAKYYIASSVTRLPDGNDAYLVSLRHLRVCADCCSTSGR